MDHPLDDGSRCAGPWVPCEEQGCRFRELPTDSEVARQPDTRGYGPMH